MNNISSALPGVSTEKKTRFSLIEQEQFLQRLEELLEKKG